MQKYEAVATPPTWSPRPVARGGEVTELETSQDCLGPRDPAIPVHVPYPSLPFLPPPSSASFLTPSSSAKRSSRVPARVRTVPMQGCCPPSLRVTTAGETGCQSEEKHLSRIEGCGMPRQGGQSLRSEFRRAR
eukprot:7565074-Pyramimonas_sp.AAC.1